MKTQTLVQLLAVAATASAAQYGSSVRRGLPAAPRRLNGRSGTGPHGFLSVDDTVYGESAPEDVKFATASTAGNAGNVLCSEQVQGAYTSCIPVFTGATVDDCQAVLGDIRANNGTISVAGGLCMNWWEGTCLARVCAREVGSVFTQESRWIADAIEEYALDVCVAKGDSGVVADCEDHSRACGQYRFWLQSFS
ncbi:hypothetical protein DL768_001123 [Monosporascus sp. mg162]|nr:hypothetical protein DL768_001123 [Monosporascus sp. mg162]